MDDAAPDPPSAGAHRRRPRYRGKHPRRFEEKYKEHNAERYVEDVAKVLASGKTPAGTHRPIMVAEVLDVLHPKPGDWALDCTLGYGGHAREILTRIRPGGRLIGLDADPMELSKTEARLRGLGFGPEEFIAARTNFAGLTKICATHAAAGVDLIFADLGVSSMQLDNPKRGFSFKMDGPLDMRMNPQRGESASRVLARMTPAKLAVLLEENADEPRAREIAEAIAGRTFTTTLALVDAIKQALPRLQVADREQSVRRVFQALRIAVNDEFSALEAFLRSLPACLKPRGRVAILTFHSGEDRRVKKAFEAGARGGWYLEIAPEVIRPSSEERRANPRSSSAKLRWARRSDREDAPGAG